MYENWRRVSDTNQKGERGTENQGTDHGFADLEFEQIDAIRRATNGNFALGGERFQKQLATASARRVAPGKSGTPRKAMMPEIRRVVRRAHDTVR